MGCCSGKTVREGQCVAVFNRRGECKIVEGPAFIRTGYYDTVQTMFRRSANENQFLVVTYRDGKVERLRGPRSMFEHPVLHQDIRTESAVHVDSDELIVTYSGPGGEQGGAVTPRIIRGPALHVPDSGEWLQLFSWHGADPSRPSRKLPGQLKFDKLRHVPDQSYFTVPDVRTADDALLELRFFVFFELTAVEVMLDTTHDPIADFMNSLAADVMQFAASLTLPRFLERQRELDTLDAFPQLVSRAKRIGFTVTQVVYRGYTSELQAMHDDAIQRRTHSLLEQETEEQAQVLADIKMTREAGRQQKKQLLQQNEVAQTNLLSRMQHEEKLAQDKAEKEAELAARQQRDALRLSFLEQLRTLNVNLTNFLVDQSAKPGQTIQIVSAGVAPAK
eukprot:TRINITY_DN2942_c0_g1_i3.p1 TRINITY_DN2942_c0_g1~~TRINITY_DN2942_c0_g1_i3.p1  ORF type:complete len:391 (-),score=122.57 TRINITY_DN2942_c0_g1_i3:130-1302(-)